MRLRLMLPTGLLTLFCAAQTYAHPLVVTCRPGEHAIVRDAYVDGRAATRVQCVSDGRYRAVTYRAYEPRYRVRRHHRSWGKTALVIGGSAGTGAGIGGIVNGKKGALIGGALGGGLGSLYESAHRR